MINLFLKVVRILFWTEKPRSHPAVWTLEVNASFASIVRFGNSGWYLTMRVQSWCIESLAYCSATLAWFSQHLQEVEMSSPVALYPLTKSRFMGIYRNHISLGSPCSHILPAVVRIEMTVASCPAHWNEPASPLQQTYNIMI